jgi:predicted metal-binding protein
MKTKTKFVVSICALTLIFSACKKDAVTPEQVLDCNGIENGVAVVDSCGDCQQAYIYNYVSHDVVYLDDTTDITLVGTTMLVMPEDAGNPYWNSGCIPAVVYDCMGVENGVAVIDSCGDCQGAYVYNMITHDPTEIVMLGGDTNGISVTLLPGQVIILPEDAGNPYWNSGCIPAVVYDCMGVENGVAVIDSCGDCQGAYVYNMITHDPTEIVMLGGDTNGVSATLLPGQVIILPEDVGNPYWNSGCK